MSGASGRSTSALGSAAGDELTRLILEAPAAELAQLPDNPRLDEHQLLVALRRPDAPAELMQRLSDDRRWIGSYLVKAAIVANVHTPKTVAMSLVKYLFWRDLARLIGNPGLHSAVRRMAEVTLRDRVLEISLGERIALARMAPREVLKTLRTESDPRVVGALLDNPRLTEEDVVVIANRTRTPPQILTLVCRSERWASRRAVRLALLRNPRTPTQNALSLLVAIADPDLKGLLEAPHLTRIVRRAAARLLAERKARRPSGHKNLR